MQPDYQGMTMAGLMDLLARETQRMTQFMMDKQFGEEYEQCKTSIQQIQAMIKARQATEKQVSQENSSPPIPDQQVFNS